MPLPWTTGRGPDYEHSADSILNESCVGALTTSLLRIDIVIKYVPTQYGVHKMLVPSSALPWMAIRIKCTVLENIRNWPLAVLSLHLRVTSDVRIISLSQAWLKGRMGQSMSFEKVPSLPKLDTPFVVEVDSEDGPEHDDHSLTVA